MIPPQSWIRGFNAAKVASKYAIAPRIGQKIGAALFSKSCLLAIGFNTYAITHPASLRNTMWEHNIHAEHRCVIKRRHYDNRNLIIYIWRERSDGTPGCSKPCLQCQSILKEADIYRVRFVDHNGTMMEMKL